MARARTLTLWSESGGVGKTTVAANLAAALGRRNADVLAIDLDPQLASLTDHMGHSDRKKASGDHLGDILLDDHQRLPELIVETPHFDLVPSHEGLANFEQNVATSNVRMSEALLFDELRGIHEQYDYILADPPASLSRLVDNAIYATRNLLVPIELTRKGERSITAIEDTVRSMERGLQRVDENFTVSILGVVPNEVGDSNVYDRFRERIRENASTDLLLDVELRKRDVIKEAWEAEQDIYAFAANERTRDLREYERDVLEAFDELAAFVTGGEEA